MDSLCKAISNGNFKLNLGVIVLLVSTLVVPRLGVIREY